MQPFELKYIVKLLARMDKLAFLCMLALLGIGVLFIRCAGMEYNGAYPTRWLIQSAFICIGMVLYFVCALTDYRQIGRFSWLMYVGGLVLLSMIFVSGGKDFGARSVLRLPGMAVQVSEPMKAAVLLFVAWVLSHPLLKYTRLSPLVIWGAIVLLPVGMITLQGDMGTGLTYLPFTFAILFINGLRKYWLIVLLVAVTFSMPICYRFLQAYQKQRIVVFLKEPCEMGLFAVSPFISPETQNNLQAKLDDMFESMKDKIRDKDGKKIEPDDWNAKQALRTVAVGGATGLGYTNGLQHTLGYLPRPVAPTDFIFAVICEETGFLGALCVIGIFVLYILLTCRTAFCANEEYGASIALGAAVLIACHCIINMGMCVGLSPIIGIPLPFVSYGGSFLLGMFLVAGMAQSVHIHTYEKKPKKEE